MNYCLVVLFIITFGISCPMNIIKAMKGKQIDPTIINRQLEKLRYRWNQLDRQRMQMFWRKHDRSASMSRLLKKQQQVGKSYQYAALKLNNKKR